LNAPRIYGTLNTAHTTIVVFPIQNNLLMARSKAINPVSLEHNATIAVVVLLKKVGIR